uniref:TNFR-Cys domain-containing protein n=1 Tax=Magallana gigas TaxID=29159 RepID=A0A8W8LTU3_MAGGI
MSLSYLLIIVDCPVGYFGVNCSDKCTPPSYGVHCSQVCECSPCDHAFGCILNTESQETEPTTAVKHKSSLKLHIVKDITNQKTQDETTTYIPNGRMEVTPTQIPKKDITPVIIIFIGSFICLVLVFELRREIKLYMEVISETSCA